MMLKKYSPQSRREPPHPPRTYAHLPHSRPLRHPHRLRRANGLCQWDRRYPPSWKLLALPLRLDWVSARGVEVVCLWDVAFAEESVRVGLIDCIFFSFFSYSFLLLLFTPFPWVLNPCYAVIDRYRYRGHMHAVLCIGVSLFLSITFQLFSTWYR